MRLSHALIASLVLAGCSQPAAPTDPATPKAPTPLGLLMKDQINAAFSKLSFLVFHGESMDDPDAVAAELQRMATTLADGTGRVKDWPDPPVTTAEGRDVFYTFSGKLDQLAARFADSVRRGDQAAQRTQLEQIAKVCNDCHHFFRLKLEDSVVGPGAPPPAGM